jgi:hypothetical protein
MTSDQVDAFLWLTDVNLTQVIAFDDDSGGGLNARIVVPNLPAGTYLILSNEFTRQTGSYTLRTSCTCVSNISATSGPGGAIEPQGTVSVNSGANQTFTMTPDTGFNILDVLVDDVSVGAVSTFTFTDVREEHTIHVEFVGQKVITSRANAGGTISPSGDVMVDGGTDQTFTITPDPGFFISDVVVDGNSIGRVNSFTFTNITSDHTIEAIFLTETHVSQRLVGYYSFAGNAKDASGFENHGTVFGGAVLAPDRFGNLDEAYDFDGTSGYIRAAGSTATLNLPSALTLTAWVKHNSNSNPQHIVNKSDAGNFDSGYRIAAWWANPTGYSLEFYDESEGQHIVDDGAAPPVGTWVHVAGTWDGNTMRIYRNGSLRGTIPFSGTIGTPNEDLFIGVILGFGFLQGFFDGLIDEVRIYDRALSDSEIAAAMQTTPDPDNDGDGMDNNFEVRFGLDRHDPNDADLDPDSDGLTNLEEYQRNSNPLVDDRAIIQIINSILLDDNQ